MWWDYDIIQGDVAAGYQRFIDVLLPLEPWERRERRERDERGTRQRTRPGSVSEAGQGNVYGYGPVGKAKPHTVGYFLPFNCVIVLLRRQTPARLN